MLIGDAPHPVADAFRQELWTRDGMAVLELGTKRWDPSFVSHHKAWAPRAEHYVMADIEAGDDVDVVTDAHDLNFVGGQFGAVIAISVWEHIRLPWIAAQEVTRVLHKGGIFYCQTHMAFPRHGFPSDFTRWTREGLSSLFEWAGLDTVQTSYTYQCRIIPPFGVDRWGWDAPAWLCVDGFFRKP